MFLLSFVLMLTTLVGFIESHRDSGPWYIENESIKVDEVQPEGIRYTVRLNRTGKYEKIVHGEINADRKVGPLSGGFKFLKNVDGLWKTVYIALEYRNLCESGFGQPLFTKLVPGLTEDCSFQPGTTRFSHWSLQECLRPWIPDNYFYGLYMVEITWAEGNETVFHMEWVISVKDSTYLRSRKDVVKGEERRKIHNGHPHRNEEEE